MSKTKDEGPLILGGTAKDQREEPTGMVPEPEILPDPEPVHVDSSPVAPPPPRVAHPPRRSGFGGTVLGGIIAAGLGYGGAAYLGDAAWPFRATTPAADVSVLQAEVQRLSAALELVQGAPDQVAALRSDLDNLSAKVETLPTTPAPAPELPDLTAPLDAVSADVGALATRVEALEKAPTAGGGVSATALAAFQRDLDALTAKVDTAPQGGDPAALAALTEEAAAKMREAEAALAAMQEQSVAASNAATARAALARLAVALDVGGDLAGAATAATAAGATGLAPESFADVPSLIEVQRSYPEAAREALAASARATAGDGVGSRVGAFLKSQFSARSLTPQEGDSPDAVLSRAEAALMAGQVAEALETLKALPEAGQTALAGWHSKAEALVAARAALDDATAALPAN